LGRFELPFARSIQPAKNAVGSRPRLGRPICGERGTHESRQLEAFDQVQISGQLEAHARFPSPAATIPPYWTRIAQTVAPSPTIRCLARLTPWPEAQKSLGKPVVQGLDRDGKVEVTFCCLRNAKIAS
jgi:hypothetical protein